MDNITYTTTDMSSSVENWKSNDITELAGALAKAQAEIEGARTDSTNPFYNSSYADLHQVIQSSFPQLTKYGLSVVQGSDWIGGNIYVTTMLCHSSGQWIKSSICMPLKEKANSQDIGAIMTYGRRYGLSAMVGVAQYDDDANRLAKAPKRKKQAKVKPLSAEEVKNGTNDIIDL